MAAFGVALTKEATVFRGMIEMLTCLAFTQDVLARPAIRDAVARYDGQSPAPAPGPDRTQLVDLLR